MTIDIGKKHLHAEQLMFAYDELLSITFLKCMGQGQVPFGSLRLHALPAL